MQVSYLINQVNYMISASNDGYQDLGFQLLSTAVVSGGNGFAVSPPHAVNQHTVLRTNVRTGVTSADGAVTELSQS